MPNGRHGDAPFSDIVMHGIDIFGGGIDGIVREIAANPNAKGILPKVAEILWDSAPYYRSPDLDDLRRRLTAIQDELARQSEGGI